MAEVKEYDVKEIQKLLGKGRSQVLRIAQKENWEVIKRKVGKSNKNYYLADVVDKYLQIRAEKKKKVTKTVIKKEVKAVDELPEWNQKTAWARYILCMKLEELYEEKRASKEEIIQDFVKNAASYFPAQMEIIKRISVPTLRRWYGVYNKNKNPLALSSGHGQNKGTRRVDEGILRDVRELYKSKNKPKMMFVYERIVAKYGKGAISYGTLRNYLNNDLTNIEKDMARMGPKEFKDTHTPFISRGYDDLRAGEVWTADGHDLEMSCWFKSGNKKILKSPKLIVWMDIKARFITGWTLSWEETTEAIAIALKNGIEKYGAPEKVYTDNGKAFKSRVLKGDEILGGIYKSLDLEVTHARAYNAQAKNIERWFVDFKESFTKSFITYKGGNIIERPERRKSFYYDKLDENMVLEKEDLEEAIEAWIKYKNDDYYKVRGGHRGKGMNGRTPLEVFNEENPEKGRRMFRDEELRLLFMYEEIRTVQQNGIEYMGSIYENENLYFHLGEKVRIKFDPHNLTYIFVYLENGEFLCKADKLQLAKWTNDIDSIKAHNKRMNKIKKLSKDIIGIREQDREETGLIEYQFKKEEKKIENKTKKLNTISIGNGLEIVI